MFATTVQTASADHYHTYNRPHGLVHGSSTTDDSFFGRTDTYYIGDTNYCYVGDTDIGANYGTVTNGAANCSVWTWAYYYSIDECRGVALNAVSGPNPLNWHAHYAHNYGGSCKVYNL